MISNLKSQLAEIGLEDRLDEVLDEAARVREDLGYLNVVTPFAQMVGTQAVINVVQGDRFATVPDEIVRYALGYYGTPLAPIEPDVLDRILSAPAARDSESEPGDLPPMLPEARKRLGKSLSDDELLLRIGIPEQYVDDMIEAGPLTPSRLSIATPLPELIKEFVDKRSLAYVHVETNEYKVTVRKSPKPQTGPDVEKTS